MPESITPLLADRLDISKARAQSLLDSMLQELRTRAEAEGVQLAGLGTFREEDGTLTFVPSSSLRRRVNHQFEGLSPEDLSGPPTAKQADREDAPTLRESPPESEPEDAPEPPPPSPEDEPSEAAPGDETIPTIDSTEDTPETPSDPDATGSDEEPEDASEPSIPTLDPIEDDPDETDDSTADSTDAAPAPDETDGDAAEDEEEEEQEKAAGTLDSFSVIGGLLAVLFLLAFGWFVITQTGLFSSSPSTSASDPTAPQTTQSQEPSSSQSETATETSDEADTDDEQPDRFAGVAPEDQASNDQATDAAATGAPGPWTIVVASRSSRSAAEQMAAKYEDRFSPVEVVAGTVDNQTWYRVTLGRYDSEAAARRALNDNASMLPSDAWTHNLQ